MTPQDATKIDREVPLACYANRLSVRPGDTIEFKVSCTSNAPQASASLSRSICADPNPAGPGVIEKPADRWFPHHHFTPVHQPFHPGSYALCATTIAPPELNCIELSAHIWPTRHKDTEQTIISWAGLSLCVDKNGRAALRCEDQIVSSEPELELRHWVRLSATFNKDTGDVSISVLTKDGSEGNSTTGIISPSGSASATTTAVKPSAVIIAASQSDNKPDSLIQNHFNGKIDSPLIRTGASVDNLNVYAHWDFSIATTSITVHDTGPNALHAQLINYPARAMTGHNWNGTEMCWRHAPEHYGAIHFHDDDIVDFNWATDFSFTVPDNMPSGIYVMHVTADDHHDAQPFYVCAPAGKPSNRLCVLIPVFTYAVYGNHARPDWAPEWKQRNEQWHAYPWNPAEYPAYGQSTYNDHTDGSGICHASHHRPLFNLRPGYITFGNSNCSGLRHFQADSHLIAWLDAHNIEFDVITDRELHNEGVAAVSGYDALLTTSHPEYHTPESLNALSDYRDQGGHLHYLGGNGFYWRVALHEENPDTIEIRRAEDGIRAWAAEPGEYYQAFDGGYGGLWRRNGRPPQALCGVGFSAQGQFNGSYYRRRTIPADLEWIFAGIDDEIIGNFGLCGNGAAGFELDRADKMLGTPANATVLASSENHGDDFMLVPEEMLTHLTTLPGPPANDLIHADIVWFETANGGSVFSVGSITFCGSLPHNNFDNNVSTMLLNVLRKALE